MRDSYEQGERMVIPGGISLFEGLSSEEVLKLLSCFGVRERKCARGEAVISRGDKVDSLGIVLSGSLQIHRDAEDGTRAIIASIDRGAVFAEAFACAGVERCPVSVIAVEDSSVLFLPFRKLVQTCSTACAFHSRVIMNLLGLFARKNLTLSAKLDVLSQRSIRGKLMTYLSSVSGAERGAPFTIPFMRHELSDYLCVDRSALSRELGKMRKEGLITVSGNLFTLHF